MNAQPQNNRRFVLRSNRRIRAHRVRFAGAKNDGIAARNVKLRRQSCV
jgi:hypothetical protein